MTASDRAEPNLTPLLDVILQLVMFFMLCANFVMEQVNESIKLPEAIAAKALDREATGFIILNVDAAGTVTVGAEVFANPLQVQLFLRNRLDADRLRTKPADWEAGRGRSVIILRGHRDCTFKQVSDVMAACRRAGYADLQLRALKAADPGAP
jgi:biopolymer transport protein ExbD